MEKDVTMTSGPADYITLDDVTRSFITANADAFDNGIYRPRAGTVKRFVTGVADAFKENLKLKDSLMIFGGQGAMMVGGVFGEDSSLSSWGREIVRAGSRQIAAIDAENAKNSDLADYEKDTFAYKLGSGFSSVFQMLLLAYVTGGAGSIGGLSKGGVQVAQKVAGVGLATVQEISSETQEGIQNYRQKTGDNDLKNYTTKEARKEFLSTAGYGVVSGALETIELSKVMPFLKEGKKVIPNFWKGAIAEGTTEMLQELANIGFDWVDGTIDFSKMPERLYGMFEQGVIGGLVGGTTAGAFSIRNRAQIKNYLREELAGVVPEKDLNSVVNKLYEDGIDTMAGIVTAELSESESLRNKHGDIYRAMMTAIDKAVTQSGAFADEESRAAYVSETAAMFADQVLAEANFRKVAIDEVLKASDIVFEDGGIKFKTGTQAFDDAGNALFQTNDISSKIAKIDADRLAFERKNINQELNGREKEEVKSVKINRFFANRENSERISFDDVVVALNTKVKPNNKGMRILKNSSRGETATLSNKALHKMFNSTSSRLGGNIGGILGKECIANIADIFDSAILVKTHNDEKHGSKNKILRYANVIQSQKNSDSPIETFIVKITVKKLENGNNDLTDIEIEENGGKELAAYDLKVGKKNTAGNSLGNFAKADKATVASNSGIDISIGDLIDFVNTFTGDDIKINGEWRKTRNSAGQRIAKTEEGLRAFYEWFGDSKVVDKDKKPLVVYHRTKEDFDIFKTKNKFGFGGAYFSDEPLGHFGENEYKCYISLKNPLTVDAKGGMYDAIQFNGKNYEINELAAYARENGFDGIIVDNVKESGGQVIVKDVIAFEPEQIKSVENVGSFDAKNPNIYYQNGGGVKGSYSPYNRLLKITEKADYSTLPHEFAHFWLSEMEGWVNSGLASDDYLKRYDIAMDWLNAEAGKPLSRRAQEQFARGYEQYLLNGNLPESPMNPLYAEYDRWLKAVYDDLNQPSKKPLTTDMVRFFQSMTTGTLPETVLPPVNVNRREKKENGEGAPRPEVAGNDEGGENAIPRREGVSKTETTTESVGNLPPIATEAKDGKVSAAAERQNRLNKISGLLKEDPQNVFYEPITLEKSAQQAEMLFERDGLDGVRDMIDGKKPMPENVIRTAVLIAYEQEMLKQGNTAEYLRVLRKHTLEQTRRGQEISAERINQDITNPSYWAKQALLGRKQALSDAVFERIKQDGDTKEKAIDRFVSETAAEYAEKLEQSADKDAVIKELNGKIKSITGEQLELFQKESVAGKTYDAVYDEIGRWIEECFDVSVSAEEMNVLKEKTDELARAFAAGLKPGENPSVEAMAKIREMRETVAAMNPTNWLSLAVNSYGRAAMLSSPKSAVLNILSNAETYVTEAITRRIANGSFEKAVDPKAVGDYLKYDYDVYKASGVMMSVVRPEEILDPARRLLGENVMSSAGAGNFRKGVRFMERLIFDWSLGTPDAKAKALSFVDNAALEATKTAKAEGLTGKALTERATALFKDACLYQPVTADGISIRNNSINAAEVATFTNNGKIAEMSGKVRNLINAATGKVRLGDFVMPFVKTPANVVALGMEYSFGLGTAALHLPQILADVRAGTLSEVSRNVIRSSIRNGIGIALAALIASLFDPEDYISSFALASQKERDLVRFKNGVYNSIKIGGKYVSLDYFGPLGAPLVGWFEAKKARGLVEKVAAFAKAAGQQFGNVPGVKELASLTGWIDKAVAQPTEKTLEDLWNGTTDQILARTVPAIVTDIAKIADPYERVSEDGVVGALAAKFPVAREALAAKADMSAGREKESEGALSVLLFGARVKTAADNAVAKEIRRLSDAGEVPQLSDVARSFKGLTDKGKARVRLEFVKGFVNPWGNKVEGYSERVARLIGSEAYRTLSDGRKKEAINKIRQKVMKELKRKYGGG